MAQTYDRRINLYINGLEVRNNMSSIRKEMFKLTNQQSLMTRGSKEYYEAAAKIKQLKAIMAQHVADNNNVGKSMNKMVGLAKQFLPALSIAAVLGGIKRMVQSFASLDDKMADVIKTTGLTRGEVSSLNREFQKIDTRSSQEELLDLARVAGKLGITGESDVLGFVRAADKIKVALSEDLGGDVEESINQLGKLVDIFKLDDKYGMEEALLKVGSAINSLGAAGTANEGYLVDFAKRLAGVAPAAGISIDKVLGLGTTLDELGQTAETSATVVNNVISTMFLETADYARIAGMEVAEFTKLLETDANEAFLKVLEGARGAGDGYASLAKNLAELGIDGARATQVLGALAENTEKIREKQAFATSEFEKGISILMEFATKNKTVQAGFDKFGKWLKNQYLNTLEAINESLKTQMNRYAENVKEFKSAQQKLTPLIKEYETLQQKTELSADEQERMGMLIQQIADISPYAITQIDEYGNVIAISTEKAAEFVEMQKAMLKYQNADAIKQTEKETTKLNSAIEKQAILFKHLVNSAEIDYKQGTRSPGFYDEQIAQADNELTRLKQQLKEKQALMEALTGDYLNTPEKNQTTTDPAVGSRKTVGNIVYEWDGKNWNEVDRIEPVDPVDAGEAAKTALEIAQKEQLLALKTYYSDKQHLQEEYNARELALELAHLQAMAALETDENKRLDLKIRIADAQIKYNDALAKAIPEMIRNEQQGDKLGTRLLETAKLTEYGSQKQYEASEAMDAYAAKQQQQAETIQMIGGAMTDYITSALNGTADSFESFGQTLVLMSLQILKQMVPIWAAQIVGGSLATPDSILTGGISGIAKFTAMLAIMYSAVAVAEGAVKSNIQKKKEASGKIPAKAAGGYTSGARIYMAGEAGEEWIAPNRMLTNPATARIIAGLEAYRTGQLNPDAVKMFASGGFTGAVNSTGFNSPPVSGGVPAGGGGIDPATARELTRALNRFADKKLIVYTELIKKDIDTLEEIEQKR